MSDAWNDAVLVEAFDAAIAKYQQMHGVSNAMEGVTSQDLKNSAKEDEGHVDSQTAESEEGVHDLGAEPRHHT